MCLIRVCCFWIDEQFRCCPILVFLVVLEIVLVIAENYSCGLCIVLTNIAGIKE